MPEQKKNLSFVKPVFSLCTLSPEGQIPPGLPHNVFEMSLKDKIYFNQYPPGEVKNTNFFNDHLQLNISFKDNFRNNDTKPIYFSGIKRKKDGSLIIKYSFTQSGRNLFGINAHKDQKLEESVCKITGLNIYQGTGFVLFDNYVLTNAHLFRDILQGEYLKQDVYGLAQFDCESESNPYTYKFIVVVFDKKDDLALLQLINDQNNNLPPGLLKKNFPRALKWWMLYNFWLSWGR